jgi:hypothetical protein
MKGHRHKRQWCYSKADGIQPAGGAIHSGQKVRVAK